MTDCNNCIFQNGETCNRHMNTSNNNCLLKVTLDEFDNSITFSLTDKEREKYENFKSHHCGATWLCFHHTGIGSLVHCYCESCHKTEDITDLDSW